MNGVVVRWLMTIGLFFFLVIGCKKKIDPLYNPNFTPGTTSTAPVFYVKSSQTGDSAFRSKNGDSLNIIGGNDYIKVVNLDYLQFNDSLGSRNYISEFIPTGGFDYRFYVLINTPINDKSQLGSYFINKGKFSYANNYSWRNKVKVELYPSGDFTKRYYSYFWNDTLNKNSTFEITSVEPYRKPGQDNSILYKVRVKYSFYAIPAFSSKYIRLKGEASVMF